MAISNNGSRLAPCPKSPNCVCSQDSDEKHTILPLAFDGEPTKAMARLKAAISRMDRTKIVAERPDYLQLEFRSKLIGYIDDVEFLLDAQQRKIHVRSASRVGRYDFGANRKRIEAVRAAFSSGGQ